jgi:hypothetical protein
MPSPHRKFKIFIKDVDLEEYHLPATCFHAGSLLIIFSDPEDGGDMFLRNVG